MTVLILHLENYGGRQSLRLTKICREKEDFLALTLRNRRLLTPTSLEVRVKDMTDVSKLDTKG